MSPSLETGEEDGLTKCDAQLGTDFVEHRLPTTNASNLDGGPTDIQRFYSGASVLVTGATGFMGKVLIEKLLRCCPDIDSVYMVVREKKGRSLDQRIDDLVGSPCFDVIKKTHPDFRAKLRVVGGDVGAEGLGITEENRQLLQQQINIVFHMAATVRFDEHLKLATLQNVRGTREVLNLCRTFRNIRSIVHVSTAYSNCPERQIDERFYDPRFPSDCIIHMGETLDLTTIDHLSHKLVGKWPNTYSFTKALSEDVVRNHGQGLPIGVFRPSIVVCTYKEPITGWIDNLYGPTGAMAATAAGLLRTMQTNVSREANLVPCDMAVSALIASARDVAENRTVGEMPVYNYVLPKSNGLTWGKMTSLYLAVAKYYPISSCIWCPMLIFSPYRAVYFVLELLVHFLPALIMDTCLIVTNRAPQMIRVYQKIHRFSQVLTYFSTNEWGFENKNTVELWNGLTEMDKKLFYFDMDSLDWFRFTKDACCGLRTNLFQDPVETLPAAKIKYKRLRILHRSLLCVLGIFVIWVSIQFLPLIGAAIQTALEYSVLSRIVTVQKILLNEVH